MSPPRFWFTPPQTPGLRARMLQGLAPLWPRPANAAPGLSPDIALWMPLGDGLTEALAVVHLAGQIPGQTAAQIARIPRRDGFDQPRFLADFLTVAASPPRESLRLAVADSPIAAKARVLLIDARLGLGNGLRRPGGPLHHMPQNICDWADIALVIGPEAQRQTFLDTAAHMGWPLPPVHAAEIRALQMGMDWTGSPVMAFSAGGFAPLLFQACRAEGADLRGAVALPQGDVPAPALLRRLQADAKRLGAQLVTTEADAQTLPRAFRREVLAMPLRLQGAEGLAQALGHI